MRELLLQTVQVEMKFFPAAAIISLLFASSSAWAQTSPVTITDFSTTLSESAVNCVPENNARKTLFIENPMGNSSNVCYSIGATSVPSCGAAGTSVLAPGTSDFFPPGAAPKDAINCIASGTGTTVTIRSGQ